MQNGLTVSLFSHPPPELANVASRTDCNIDDEAAGFAREEYRTRSVQRRAAEAARIAAENAKNKQRIAGIKTKTNDGDNGLTETPYTEQVSLRLRGCRNFREMCADRYQQRVMKAHAQHKERLAVTTSAIDDDTEDDATGEARARMREESAARRQAEAEELRAANASYRARIAAVITVTDSKVWDDGEGSAGAARSIVAARSRARKKAEAEKLAAENTRLKKSLSGVRARTDDGDGLQF